MSEVTDNNLGQLKNSIDALDILKKKKEKKTTAQQYSSLNVFSLFIVNVHFMDSPNVEIFQHEVKYY